MFKYSLNLILMIVFVAASLNAQTPKNPNDGPKLEIVGGDTYDWKRVTPKDNPLKAKIQLRNVGNDILKIAEVKPGCGCTTAPLDKNELKPGETANLDVTLNVSGSGSHQVTKTIRITSNDLNDPNKMLILKADMFQPIEIMSPNYFAFGEMRVGFESASAVKVKNNTDKPLTLSNFEISPANTSININNPKTLKPGEEIEFIAKSKPSAQGYFNCMLKMKTDNTEYPELTIHGYGNVKDSPVFNNK